MKRRLLSLFLAFVTILSLLPTALAASSEEDALGEVDIYNGDYELGYLAINGTVRKQKYTYFLYESNDGSTKESPAYCVNPNQYGVPQTVGPGESIKYLAEEKASDPKVVGIISNGYPHRSLGELGLENKYQAFYATKMALWYYLIPSWDISNLKVAPGLSGSELDIGNRILAAAKDIYKRGTTYNYMLTPRMTVTADKSTAYPVTIGGQAYLQQVFTIWSETWVYDYDVSVAFSDPDSVPEARRSWIPTTTRSPPSPQSTPRTAMPGPSRSSIPPTAWRASPAMSSSPSPHLWPSTPPCTLCARRRTNMAICRIISVTWTTRCSWTWPLSAAIRTVGNPILMRRPEDREAGGGHRDPSGGGRVLRVRPGGKKSAPTPPARTGL